MKQKIQLVLSILFGLMFINAGLNKLFHYIPVPKDTPESLMKMMTSLMELGWFLPLVAVVEIIGGLLFITNRFRALAALILLPILVGIITFHAVAAPSGLPMGLILFAIMLWVMYDNRSKYLPLVQ